MTTVQCLLCAIVTLAPMIMAGSSFRRGRELIPSTDEVTESTVLDLVTTPLPEQPRVRWPACSPHLSRSCSCQPGDQVECRYDPMLLADLANMPDGLEALVISKADFEDWPGKLFEGLYDLKRLDLSMNSIRQLDPLAFYGLFALRRLRLDRNNIVELPERFQDTVPVLKWLSISDNQITEIAAVTYRLPGTIESIDLSVNMIQSLSASDFRKIPGLKRLVLAKNLITSISAGIFTSLPDLEHLDLSSNRIVELDLEAFRGLDSLKVIDLSGMSTLKFLSDEHFPAATALPKLEAVYLEKTLLLCDCFLAPFKQWTLNNSKIAIHNVHTCRQAGSTGHRSLSGVVIEPLDEQHHVPIRCGPICISSPRSPIDFESKPNPVYFEDVPLSDFVCHTTTTTTSTTTTATPSTTTPLPEPLNLLSMIDIDVPLVPSLSGDTSLPASSNSDNALIVTQETDSAFTAIGSALERDETFIVIVAAICGGVFAASAILISVLFASRRIARRRARSRLLVGACKMAANSSCSANPTLMPPPSGSANSTGSTTSSRGGVGGIAAIATTNSSASSSSNNEEGSSTVSSEGGQDNGSGDHHRHHHHHMLSQMNQQVWSFAASTPDKRFLEIASKSKSFAVTAVPGRQGGGGGFKSSHSSNGGLLAILSPPPVPSRPHPAAPPVLPPNLAVQGYIRQQQSVTPQNLCHSSSFPFAFAITPVLGANERQQQAANNSASQTGGAETFV